MPYKIRKAPKKELYWVITIETGKKHSKLPIPLDKAKAQMRILETALDGGMLGAFQMAQRKKAEEEEKTKRQAAATAKMMKLLAERKNKLPTRLQGIKSAQDVERLIQNSGKGRKLKGGDLREQRDFLITRANRLQDQIQNYNQLNRDTTELNFQLYNILQRIQTITTQLAGDDEDPQGLPPTREDASEDPSGLGKNRKFKGGATAQQLMSFRKDVDRLIIEVQMEVSIYLQTRRLTHTGAQAPNDIFGLIDASLQHWISPSEYAQIVKTSEYKNLREAYRSPTIQDALDTYKLLLGTENLIEYTGYEDALIEGLVAYYGLPNNNPLKAKLSKEFSRVFAELTNFATSTGLRKIEESLAGPGVEQIKETLTKDRKYVSTNPKERFEFPPGGGPPVRRERGKGRKHKGGMKAEEYSKFMEKNFPQHANPKYKTNPRNPTLIMLNSNNVRDDFYLQTTEGVKRAGQLIELSLQNIEEDWTLDKSALRDYRQIASEFLSNVRKLVEGLSPFEKVCDSLSCAKKVPLIEVINEQWQYLLPFINRDELFKSTRPTGPKGPLPPPPPNPDSRPIGPKPPKMIENPMRLVPRPPPPRAPAPDPDRAVFAPAPARPPAPPPAPAPPLDRTTFVPRAPRAPAPAPAPEGEPPIVTAKLQELPAPEQAKIREFRNAFLSIPLPSIINGKVSFSPVYGTHYINRVISVIEKLFPYGRYAFDATQKLRNMRSSYYDYLFNSIYNYTKDKNVLVTVLESRLADTFPAFVEYKRQHQGKGRNDLRILIEFLEENITLQLINLLKDPNWTDFNEGRGRSKKCRKCNKFKV